MARSLFDPSSVGEWLQAIRLDFSGPMPLLESLGIWLAQAPAGVIVTAAATLVALLAFTRRAGSAALIVILALSLLGVVGLAL